VMSTAHGIYIHAGVRATMDAILYELDADQVLIALALFSIRLGRPLGSVHELVELLPAASTCSVASHSGSNEDSKVSVRTRSMTMRLCR
jgi:hypothetical protein